MCSLTNEAKRDARGVVGADSEPPAVGRFRLLRCFCRGGPGVSVSESSWSPSMASSTASSGIGYMGSLRSDCGDKAALGVAYPVPPPLPNPVPLLDVRLCANDFSLRRNEPEPCLSRGVCSRPFCSVSASSHVVLLASGVGCVGVDSSRFHRANCTLLLPSGGVPAPVEVAPFGFLRLTPSPLPILALDVASPIPFGIALGRSSFVVGDGPTEPGAAVKGNAPGDGGTNWSEGGRGCVFTRSGPRGAFGSVWPLTTAALPSFPFALLVISLLVC